MLKSGQKYGGFGLTLAVITTLTACQTPRMVDITGDVTKSPHVIRNATSNHSVAQTDVSNTVSTVNIERTMVSSYHRGRDADGKPYLLLVFNTHGMAKLNNATQNNPTVQVKLLGKTFEQVRPINTGFMVLSPIPNGWTNGVLAKALR